MSAPLQVQLDRHMRLDRWLWAVRVYKTRSASNAVKCGRVSVDHRATKPSHQVRAGEIISISLERMTRTLKVIGAPTARMGAKLVSNFVEDLTPPEELERQRGLPAKVLNPGFRLKGSGRPTKRDRRMLRQFGRDHPEKLGDHAEV